MDTARSQGTRSTGTRSTPFLHSLAEQRDSLKEQRDPRLTLVADQHHVPRLLVSNSPQISVLSMIGAVCGRHGDVPTKVREHILSRVSPLHLLDAWRPMRSTTDNFAPDAVAPDWPGDVSVAEYVEWLRDHGRSELVRQIHEAGAHGAGAWPRELADPGRWVDAYASASLATWKAMSPLWQSRQKLIESEMLRIGLAQVRGAGEELLNFLHPAITFEGNSILITTGDNRRLDVAVGTRAINLVPMIAGSECWYVSFENPDVVTLAYGLQRSTTESRRSDDGGDSIALLLGQPRAAALHFLRKPRRVGELAKHLNVAPSTATHHCDLLETAGLISRDRVGKSVMVTATERGRELVQLFR